MAIKYPALTGENASINASVATQIDLPGTALTIGGVEARTFAEAAADSATDFDDADTVAVFIKKDATNWARWLATWSSAGASLTQTTPLESKGTIGVGDAVEVFVAAGEEELSETRLAKLVGASLSYNNATTVDLSAGKAFVNDRLLAWNTTLNTGVMTLTPDTRYYVYLFDSTGAAIDASTTEPAYNSSLKYYANTAAATGAAGGVSAIPANSRCIGFFFTDSSGNVGKFVCSGNGNLKKIVHTRDASGIQAVINHPAGSTTWTSASASNVIPINSVNAYVYADIQNGGGSAGWYGYSYSLSIQPTSSTWWRGHYVLYLYFSTTTGSQLVGSCWQPVQPSVSRNIYWCGGNASSQPGISILGAEVEV